MILDVKFVETNSVMDVEFGEVHEVSDGGYEKGYADGKTDGEAIGYERGHTVGVTDGQQAEYDRFWDAFQQNGSRRSYYNAFTKTWGNSIFRPKYPIIAEGDASYMFDGCQLTDFDFVANGVQLDVSGATSLTYCFRSCYGITRLGVIDCTGCKDLNRLFYACQVVTIDKFVVNENITYSNTFDYTYRLENITFEGVIGRSINFQYCSLSMASAKNIILCLKDYTGTDKEFTYTVRFTNSVWETLDADGATAPGGITWKTYVDNLCWNR